MSIQYLNMAARVTIANVVFNQVSSVRIQETIAEIGNTATVELPRNFKKLDGRPVLDYICPGDRVKIELGYNGALVTEFAGYVRQISAEAPLVIECDDDWYLLKQTKWNKSYKSVTLKALLAEIAPGYEVDAPDMSLGKFIIDNNASTYEVMRKIQSDYGLFTRIAGKKLTVGFSYDWGEKTKRLIYHRQKNVRASRLEWRRKEDVKVRVKIEYWEGKKKKVIYRGGNEEGKGTAVKESPRIYATKADAEKAGDGLYGKVAFDGFTGSITGFGVPATHAGDTIELQDALNPEKNGVYVTDKVNISYGPDGFSRECQLAHKIG